MQESDALLLGCRTWQGHGAAFDPMPAGDPFSDAMEEIRKYVVSTTLTNTDLWRNSPLLKGNVAAQLHVARHSPTKPSAMNWCRS
jgi:hypothetical protein